MPNTDPSTDPSKIGNFGIPDVSSEMKSTPKWATLDAKKEDKGWGTLDEIKIGNDRRWLIVYGWILVVVTAVFASIFILSFGIWAFHHLSPYGWLDVDRLAKIQSILFSGGMGAIVTSIVTTQISKAQIERK